MQLNVNALPVITTDEAAFFFDLDGTLAALQPAPELVTVPAEVCHHLRLLYQKTAGAVAIISGRPLSQIDQLLAPLLLPAAGIHGAECRDYQGKIHRVIPDAGILDETEQQLRQGIKDLPGVRLEKKGIAFALHYRQATHFASQAEALAQSVVRQNPSLTLQTGKCVVELKPANIDKGKAINAFLQQPPFRGRIPVFLGDDQTDELGFNVVNSLQGISIKIGQGATQARYRLQSTTDVYHWLTQLPGVGDQPAAGNDNHKESTGWTD